MVHIICSSANVRGKRLIILIWKVSANINTEYDIFVQTLAFREDGGSRDRA